MTGLLDDDNVLISSLCKRMFVGVNPEDMCLTHANYGDIGDINFYNVDKTELTVAISVKTLLQQLGWTADTPNAEVYRVVDKCIANGVNSWIPMCCYGSHQYWGQPIVRRPQSKIRFRIKKELDAGEESVSSTAPQQPTPPEVHPPTTAPSPPPTAGRDAEALATCKVPPPAARVGAKRGRDPFQNCLYNGVRYDSEDEARHAVFLNHIQLQYKHQPVVIHLPLGGIYRTDFFVPSLNAYLEVTQGFPAETKKYNCEQLALHARTEDPHQDWGYYWVRGEEGTYTIAKMTSTQDVSWRHDNLLAAYDAARGHRFE
jgi:hypothetical protein